MGNTKAFFQQTMIGDDTCSFIVYERISGYYTAGYYVAEQFSV